MTVTPEVRELAAKTAAEIRRRGWIQGSFHGGFTDDDDFDVDNCKVCALGGINVAGGVFPDGDFYLWGGGRDLTTVVANRVSANPNQDITSRVGPEWNDRPERTVDDVLAVFDQIASGQ